MKRKKTLSFAREFIRNRKQLGTPFPSSRYLARAIAKYVVGYNIVELGAGQGQVTKAILHRHPNIKLTAFEINQGLLEHLAEIEDPRLRVVEASAEHFSDYVPEFQCVVSGLPLTSMPEEVVHELLTTSKRAQRYIQYKYFPEGNLLKKYFSNVKLKIVFMNPLPALVYVCSNNGSNTPS